MSTFMLSARHIAFDILKRVDSETQTLDHWLDEYREPIDRLNRPDRALVHALVYGALRWQGRLDWIIDQLAVKPGKKVDARVRIALRIGLFQLLHLERIPASAAVNTTVDLVKACGCSWAKGFVNSMLRIVSEKRRPLDFPDMHENPVLALSIKHAFPVWLIERWQKRYGIEQTDLDMRGHQCNTAHHFAGKHDKSTAGHTDRTDQRRGPGCRRHQLFARRHRAALSKGADGAMALV